MIIIFSENPPFKVGDIVNLGRDTSGVVIKVYKWRWWKPLIMLVGFKPVVYGIKIREYGI